MENDYYFKLKEYYQNLSPQKMTQHDIIFHRINLAEIRSNLAQYLQNESERALEDAYWKEKEAMFDRAATRYGMVKIQEGNSTDESYIENLLLAVKENRISQNVLDFIVKRLKIDQKEQLCDYLLDQLNDGNPNAARILKLINDR